MTSCVKKIGAAHEGVRVTLAGGDRGIGDENLVTGWVWYMPGLRQVYVYPMTVKTIDYPPFTVYDSEGTEYIIDPMVSLYIQPSASPRIVAKYLQSLENIIRLPIYNYTKEAFRMEFNKFTTQQVIESRDSLENNVSKRLQEKLFSEGFELDLLTPGIRFPEQISKEIIAKNAAVQIALRKQNELVGEQADADKRIVSATAERDANKLKEASITPKILQQLWIEKWDGKVPTVAGNNGIMVNLNDLK